jgi:hypothetical protein
MVNGVHAMRSFFKGWRRKPGCVTLVMALTLTAGSLRSSFRHETLTIWSLNHHRIELVSADNFVILVALGYGFTVFARLMFTRNLPADQPEDSQGVPSSAVGNAKWAW